MRRTVSLFALFLMGVAPPVIAETFSAGDIVMVYGGLKGCDDIEGLLEFSQVEANGLINLFSERTDHEEITIQVKSLSPSEVEYLIGSEIEKHEGYRPNTLRVELLSVSELVKRHAKTDIF